MNRRSFLRTGASVAAGCSVAPQIVSSKTLGLGNWTAPSEKIRVGFIGLGRHARPVNLGNTAGFEDCSIATLCDADSRQIDRAVEQLKGTANVQFDPMDVTQDWREVIHRDDVDAVMITTPDHWHIPMSLAALDQGKDVMCEKTSYDITEGRELVKRVDKYGAVFQMAMEDRALPEYRRMVEVVRNGGIGQLERVEFVVPFGVKEQVPLRQDPIPAELDWNLWLGPAPDLPFQKERIMADYSTGVGWRNIRDYGGGKFTDWGVHLGDTAIWAMDDDYSQSFTVETDCKYIKDSLFDRPMEYNVRYEMENGVEIAVTSGTPALKFIGTDGWIGNVGWRAPLEASSQKVLNTVYGMSNYKPRIYHREQRDFIDAVRSRASTMYGAEYYHRISSWLIAANHASLLDRKLSWDAKTESYINDDAANAMRTRNSNRNWEAA